MSAIDIALWDIRGKVEGKPVADLLGKRQRNRLLAYGTVYPLGETADEVRSNIDRGLKLGLKAIKIVADPHWRLDVRKAEIIIRTARDHVGPDIRLMVDAATAWDKAEDGLPLMPIFRDNNFLWVEAPLPIDDWKVMRGSRVSAFRSAAAISASPRATSMSMPSRSARSTSPSRT
jgi:L-alanine-DL-glutamate epimerase-like enolase superfamily enzyme